MSSVLNVSNGRSRPEKFSVKDIEVLVDKKEQIWFKRAHIARFLGIACIITSTGKLSGEDIRSWTFLQAKGEIHIMDSPREDAQDHDIFISLTDTLYVTVKIKIKCLRNTP